MADGINDVFDLDLDGKPDFFDIDADNDGITDVIEANASGAVIANYDPTTGRITGAVGANGMPDAAETAAENGVTKFPLTEHRRHRPPRLPRHRCRRRRYS